MTAKKVASLQRLIDVAAARFLAHRYEDVSMAAVAREAHCSTVTIYEIYGSKEGLFVAAMTERLGPPTLPQPTGTAPFDALLDYTCARIAAVTSREVSAVLRALVRRPELAQAAFLKVSAEHDRLTGAALDTLIADAQHGGMLRPMATEVVKDHVMAMTQAPILSTLLNDGTCRRQPERIVHNLFAPFVTDRGKRCLQRFLREHQPTTADRRARLTLASATSISKSSEGDTPWQ